MSRLYAACAAAVAALALSISAGSCSLLAGLDGLHFTTGSGGGSPSTCDNDAQCDDGNACTADTCTADGVCSFDAVPDGPASAGQTAGDCKTVSCQGGVLVSVDDDADVPSDGEDCTVDACKAGMATHIAVPDDTPCVAAGQPGSCAGGACHAGDCSGTKPCPDPGACATVACDVSTGKCLVTPLPDGFPTPNVVDVPGDCHFHICKNGLDFNNVDDSDVPTTATDCDEERCNQGMSSNPPLPIDTACSTAPNGPGHCDGAGACVECNDDNQCSGTVDDCQHPICTAHACAVSFTPAGTPIGVGQVAGDCQSLQCDGAGGVTSVADDADMPVDGKPCTSDVCLNGTPSNPPLPAGTPCGVLVCNATGDCGCQSNGDCAMPNTCGGGNPGTPLVCGCTKTTCAAQAKTCGSISDACFGMLDCNTGTKNGTETDVDCGGAAAGCAVRCTQGKKCGATADCVPGLTCADGVCCNVTCGALCNACTAVKKGSGVDGVCGAIAAGTDPDNECAAAAVATCGNDGFCNGASACRKWPSGTICVAQGCMAGVQSNADTCNGSGMCLDGGTVGCGLYACGAFACNATCTSDPMCAATAYCSASVCVAKKPPNAPCLANNECISNVCKMPMLTCQ